MTQNWYVQVTWSNGETLNHVMRGDAAQVRDWIAVTEIDEHSPHITGFVAIAVPTARLAFGLPTRVASSP